MKIRKGFVTNSSSTSFIISLKESFSKTNFMDSIGANGDSPMNKIFEDLFNAIEDDKENIIDSVKKYGEEIEIEKFLLNQGFSKETINMVESLLSAGRDVYYGQLRSDGETPSEAFFCCESFVICDENIYFNGNIGGW
jgi:hypothetical protein